MRFYENYQANPTTITHIVQAVAAASAQSKYLLIQSKSPLLLVETVAYDQSGIPIEFGRSYYRADRYEYRVAIELGISDAGIGSKVYEKIVAHIIKLLGMNITRSHYV